MIRDAVAVNNERVKLLAGFLNAIGIGLIGVGVLAPLAGSAPADDGQTVGALLGDAAPMLLSGLSLWPLWLLAGLALHGMAHYVMGRLKKAGPP